MATYRVRDAAPDEVQNALTSYPPLVRELLYARGIETKEAAEAFLRPRYPEDTHSAALLDGIDAAAKRIQKATDNSEKVVIYSDYDMDGIPGATVLRGFFDAIGYKEIAHYIPHRNSEGFGLNLQAIEKLADQGARLIITVDCGITDVAQVERANELGIDVIVTDHHLPQEVLPPAVAIVNPNKPGDAYPNKDLCGAGVAFKLVEHLVQVYGIDLETHAMLDLVASATIADMMPLTGENRALVQEGLTWLRKSERPGLKALLYNARASQAYLTEDDVSFTIAPRVNAASRMDRAELALNLLATHDDREAKYLARDIEALNNERKGVIAAMVKDARKRLDAREELHDVIVIGDPRWMPGLAGLAAHRLTEVYGRPTFVWGRNSGAVSQKDGAVSQKAQKDGAVSQESPNIKGSCRSDGTVNISELMTLSADAFESYGGHQYSGGFETTEQKIHTLEEVLNRNVSKLDKTAVDTENVADLRIRLEDVSWELYRTMEQLAPFGQGNPKPLFLVEHITPTRVEMFGKAKEHMKLQFSGGVSALRFFAQPEDFDVPVEAGTPIDMVVHLEQSFFRGRPELRLRIVDIV